MSIPVKPSLSGPEQTRVAALAVVGLSTVRRALLGKPIKDTTRERINTALEQLGMPRLPPQETDARARAVARPVAHA